MTNHARNCSHVDLWFDAHSLLYAIITSPLAFCVDFHSRAQGRVRIRKGGVFRAQHECDTYGMEWTFELHMSGQGDGDGERLNLCN